MGNIKHCGNPPMLHTALLHEFKSVLRRLQLTPKANKNVNQVFHRSKIGTVCLAVNKYYFVPCLIVEYIG